MDRKIFVVSTVLSILIVYVFLLFTDTQDNKMEAIAEFDIKPIDPEIMKSLKDAVKVPDTDDGKPSDAGDGKTDLEDEMGYLVIKLQVPKKGIIVQAQSRDGAPVDYKYPRVLFNDGENEDVVYDADDDVHDADVECYPESGENFEIGTTTVTCTAEYENEEDDYSEDKKFKVKVIDTNPPNILNAQNTIGKMQDASGAIVYFSVTATDTVEGPLPIENINCNPKSGSQFQNNNTKVSCTAFDSRGNNATKSFYVILKDEEAPKIDVPNLEMVTKTQNPSKAEVQFSVNAVDAVDGPIPVENINCNPKSGSQFSVGIPTPITCTASDKSNNIATVSFELDLSS